MPSNQLELALWLESDRMGYLLDKVDQAKLSNQQDVVRNERRQSVENQPYGIVEEALFQQLFPQGHPYYAQRHRLARRHPGGEARRREALLQAVLRAEQRQPRDRRRLRQGAGHEALVEKYFGTLSAASRCRADRSQTPPITAERRAVVQDRVELPRVYMAWLTSPIFKPGDADADIAATILGGGRSSRLYKKLVYEKQIAQDVSAQQYSLMLGSVFQIEATARPGHTAEELEKAIDEELDAVPRVRARRRREVERARNTIETRIIQGLETLGGFGGVADRLNTYNHYLGDPGLSAEGHRALPRRRRRRRCKAFARSSSTPTRASSSTACRAQPDLGAPVPTPTAGAGARRDGRRVGQRRRAVAQGARRRPGRGASAAAADADVVPAAERPDGAPQRAAGPADRGGQPRA